MKKVLFLFTLIFMGCHSRPDPSSLPRNVIGKVGTTIITDQDLLQQIQKIEKKMGRSYTTHTQKKDLLLEIMHIELLYQEALKHNFDKQLEFKSRLADLWVQKIAEEARTRLSEKELRKFFNKNRRFYEQISVRHILLKFQPKISEEKKKGLYVKLRNIWKELIQKSESFSEYAQKYSEDTSGQRGGELGFFTKAQMVEPFAEAAFKLKKIGDISPIVETNFGYHLIQLSGDRRSFEFHKELVRDHGLRLTQQERLGQELTKLKKGITFEIYETRLLPLSPLPSIITIDPAELLKERRP